jgi:hypothetical protein
LAASDGGPGGSATTTETYAYDAVGRLSATTRDGWLTVNLRKYDAAGRIVRSGAVGVGDTINYGDGRDARDLSHFFRLVGGNTEYTLTVYYHGQLYRQKNLEWNENTGTTDHDGQGGNGNDTYFFDGLGTGYDGADKDYDTVDFVPKVRKRKITSHVAKKKSSAVDARTTRYKGYAQSIKKRKFVGESFGWAKTVCGLRDARFVGGGQGQNADHVHGCSVQIDEDRHPSWLAISRRGMPKIRVVSGK